MVSKDLLDGDSATAYPVTVKNEQFWRLVGLELARLRERAGYVSTLDLTKKRREAPAKNTLDDIERGRPGTIDKLEGYCTTLGHDLTAVIRTVLAAEDDETVLSADALWVGRMYQDGPNEDLRKALRGAAEAQQALQRAALASAPVQPAAATASAGGSRGRGRTVRHHR
jgi:hypothetical protein